MSNCNSQAECIHAWADNNRIYIEEVPKLVYTFWICKPVNHSCESRISIFDIVRRWGRGSKSYDRNYHRGKNLYKGASVMYKAAYLHAAYHYATYILYIFSHDIYNIGIFFHKKPLVFIQLPHFPNFLQFTWFRQISIWSPIKVGVPFYRIKL